MLTTCSKQWLSSNTGLTSSKCFCNYWGSNHHFQQTQTQFRLGNNKPCNGSVICLHVENSLNTSVVNREVIKCLSKIPRDNGACVLSPSVLSDSLDSLLDSSVHGVFQVRILEWVAISHSRGSSLSRDQTCVSCISRWILCHCATWEVPERVG